MDKNKQYFSRLAAIIQSLALGAVYTFFAIKAVLEFRVDWDFLSYHLPDALARFGLTTYLPESQLRELNQAFPPLPHLVQGFLVYLTGRISAAQGLPVLGFALLLVGFLLLFNNDFSFRWFLTTCLALPLFQYHFVSGYVDLFQASLLVLGIASFLKCEVELRTGVISRLTFAIEVTSGIPTGQAFWHGAAGH